MAESTSSARTLADAVATIEGAFLKIVVPGLLGRSWRKYSDYPIGREGNGAAKMSLAG